MNAGSSMTLANDVEPNITVMNTIISSGAAGLILVVQN